MVNHQNCVSQDLFIGAQVFFRSHQFVITDADEYAMAYAEKHKVSWELYAILKPIIPSTFYSFICNNPVIAQLLSPGLKHGSQSDLIVHNSTPHFTSSTCNPHQIKNHLLTKLSKYLRKTEPSNEEEMMRRTATRPF